MYEKMVRLPPKARKTAEPIVVFLPIMKGNLRTIGDVE